VATKGRKTPPTPASDRISIEPAGGHTLAEALTPPATPEARAAEIKKKGRVELGVTGTPVFAGFIQSDPNQELNFPKSVEIYDKMRRTDGQVKSSILAITLPVLSLEWDIEPYKPTDTTGAAMQADPRDIEVAKFVKADLLEGMTTPWKLALRQILGMLWAGFWIMEPVWEVGEDGKIHLRKLAPRLPKTVFRWIMERDGGLKTVIQRGMNPATGAIEQIDLPIERLLVFTHEKEGANWTGLSVLRSAYLHFYFKQWLYRIGAVNVERGGGVPVLSLPENADDDDKRAARDVGESFHLHERAYVLEPFGWKFRMETGTSRIGDVMSQVEHHNQQIVANILAQFMDQSGSITSRAGTSEFMDIFLMALEAVIGNVEETINRHLLQPWCDMNFPGLKGYPKLKAQNIRGFNVRRMGIVLRALADGRLISPDEQLEGFLRQGMGLPEADPDTRRQVPAPGGGFGGGSAGGPAPITGPGAVADPAAPGEATPPGDRVPTPDRTPTDGELAERSRKRVPLDLAGPLVLRRALTDLEEHVEFAEIDGRTKRAALALVEKVGPVVEDQVRALASIARRPLSTLTSVRVPYVGKVSAALKSELKDVFRFGRASVRGEVQRQAAAKRALAPSFKLVEQIESDSDASDFFNAKSDVLAERWATRLKDAAVSEKLRAVRAGLSDVATEGQVAAALKALSDKATRAMIFQTVVEAFGLGRRLEAEDQADRIQSMTYSALLDENTCLLPGTMIRTTEGHKAVEAVRVGDAVLTGDNTFEPVLGVFIKPAARAVEIVVDDRRLRVTPDHRLLVEREGSLGWLAAGAMRAGDLVLRDQPSDDTADAGSNRVTFATVAALAAWRRARVESVRQVSHEGEVYDIALGRSHTFFADGILVHNCDVCEALDGQEGPLDDAEIQTPNPNCLGERHGASCRCINVYTITS